MTDWPQTLVLAGAGKMGGAMLRGWLAGGLRKAGVSLIEPRDVGTIVWERLPATLELVLCALALAIVFGVPLAWLLARKGVMSVIVGAKTLDQLNDNIAATKLSLSAEDMAELDKISALAPEYPGWMIARQADQRVPAPKD